MIGLRVVSALLVLMCVTATAAAEDPNRYPGWKTYVAKCSSCHGKDGKGQTKMGKKLKVPDLTDADTQNGLTDEQIRTRLRKTYGIADKQMICDLLKIIRAFAGRAATCPPRPPPLPSPRFKPAAAP